MKKKKQCNKLDKTVNATPSQSAFTEFNYEINKNKSKELMKAVKQNTLPSYTKKKE